MRELPGFHGARSKKLLRHPAHDITPHAPVMRLAIMGTDPGIATRDRSGSLWGIECSDSQFSIPVSVKLSEIEPQINQDRNPSEAERSHDPVAQAVNELLRISVDAVVLNAIGVVAGFHI